MDGCRSNKHWMRAAIAVAVATPLLGIAALNASAQDQPAGSGHRVVSQAATQAQVRAKIAVDTRYQLTNPRPYQVGGHRYESSPNIAGHYNYLGRNGSNENRNIYSSYRSESWCGDFARFVWTSGGRISAPVPSSYASSQAWRTGVGSRWHTFSTSRLPQVGDVLVWTDKSSSSQGHVAVVTYVNSAKRTITFIGGNVWIAGNRDSIVERSAYWSKMGASMSGKTFRGFASRF